METNLDALFTTESLLSLQGAAIASSLVANAFGYLIGDKFDAYRKWVSFAIAMFLAYLVAILAAEAGWFKWVQAFFNGLLVFSSAVGLNEAVGRSSRYTSMSSRGGKLFFKSWLP